MHKPLTAPQLSSCVRLLPHAALLLASPVQQPPKCPCAACLLCLGLQGVAAANISVSPVPVTPTFLSERIADLSKATSKAIHNALRDARLLDADGMLVKDPRWVPCRLLTTMFKGHLLGWAVCKPI